MTNPSIQLADLICNALVETNIVGPDSINALKQQILSGKTKSEDWKLAVEKNIKFSDKGDTDGK